jgi:hypothetical protein
VCPVLAPKGAETSFLPNSRTCTHKGKTTPSPSVHAVNSYSAAQPFQCKFVSHRRWHWQHHAQRGTRVTDGIFTSLTATMRHHTFQPRQPTTSHPMSASASPLALHLREDQNKYPMIKEPRKCIKKSPASLKLSFSKRTASFLFLNVTPAKSFYQECGIELAH